MGAIHRHARWQDDRWGGGGRGRGATGSDDQIYIRWVFVMHSAKAYRPPALHCQSANNDIRHCWKLYLRKALQIFNFTHVYMFDIIMEGGAP
jgi:hypothetical protein